MSDATWLRQAILLFVLAGLSCTPPRPPRDPFAGAQGTRREGVETFQIRLEVNCDRCLISYNVGPQRGSDEASPTNPVWSRRFERFTLQPEAIRLTASTGPQGGRLDFVRIWVDGELADQTDCNCDQAQAVGGQRITISAETVIPR